MKLPRVDQDTRKPSILDQIHTISVEQKSQQEEPQQPAEAKPEDYRSALDRMSEELLLLSQQNLTDAETKYRLALIIATVREQNTVLANFLSDIKEEMETMNSNQLQLLSEQELYAKSVRDNVSRSVYDVYSRFKEEQKKAFDDVAEELKKTIDELKGEIDQSVELCKKQTTDLWTAFRCSRNLDNWLDRFYFIAPVSIIGYVIFKIVTFFIQ